jgi:hypothetical protein
MASFKGDSYYEAHVDMEHNDGAEEEETPHDEHLERHVIRTFRDWSYEHHDVLEQLYFTFKDSGRSVFGNSFWQLGTYYDFVKVLFKYTQPGAH